MPDGTIYGHVYDAQTKQPIPQAFVYCQGAKCPKQMTDSDGYYAIVNCFSPSSTYVIECTKNGYATTKNTAKTDPSGKTRVDFDLVLESQKSNPQNQSSKPNSKLTPAKSWKKTFGGSKDDWGNSVQQTSDGGYIIAGQTASYGAGKDDAWLIKTDADGNRQWDKTFGGSGIDRAESVQQTNDGGYIFVGYTQPFDAGKEDVSMYIWLIKTDANGNKLWEKTFDRSTWGIEISLQQTSDGGYIITGGKLSYGSTNLAGIDDTLAGLDVWLIKTDSNGDRQWDRTFGGSNSYECGSSVKQTKDGGYIIAGGKSSYGVEDPDIWLIKTDASGNKLWDKIFRELGFDIGESVEQTNDGGYIITGWTAKKDEQDNPYTYVSLIKTDPNGNEQWDKTFGSGNDEGDSVQQTSDGGYIIAGSTSHGAGSSDIWLVKTDANGNKLWDRIFGGLRQDDGHSVQQTSDGGYIIAGKTHSEGAGGFDIWLIKTDSEGN